MNRETGVQSDGGRIHEPVHVPGHASGDRPIPENHGEVSDSPLPLVALDDPHLRPAAKNVRHTERWIAFLIALAALGFAGYGAVYWQGGQPQLEGLTLGIGLLAIGAALAAWGKYLLPRGPFVEERHDMRSSDVEREQMAAAVIDRGKLVMRRRGFLGKMLAGAAGILGVVIAFPVIRSLGPLPKLALDKTNWRKGSYLVTIHGRKIKEDDLEVGGIITVFPPGYEGNAMDQTVLLRASTSPFTTKAGRETWTPKGYVAYSKVCTHAGCPVGLYQEQTQQLLCPCHQSMFDVLDGAQPVFGPAPRPLPQLPLMIDSEGYLRAQQPYDQPVGPGFWERS
ncbi:MAG: Rieske 2Fe-2S domain-containing protein [Actinobacteria bacterium]|nr:Rieske 2Fe-2S domain-containing protein [Actinomycetota bacterium]